MCEGINWRNLENWKEAFDILEERDYNKIVVKYLQEKTVVEILGKDFYEDVHKNASVICKADLQGKHIGLIGETSYDLLVNFCAILYTGSVAVVVSKDLTAKELNKIVEQAEMSALIYDIDQEKICLQVDHNVKLIAIGRTDISDVLSMEEERKKDNSYIVNYTHREDMVNISFTSGTSGKNKAVIHTNGTLIAGTFPDVFGEDFNSPLVMFPFHHVTGFVLPLVGLSQGKTVCIGSGFQNIYRYLRLLKPDCILLVPALLESICRKLKKHTQEELGWNLKLIVCGGAKCPVYLFEIVMKRGIIMKQAYGATETLGRGIICRVSSGNLDSIGRPGYLMEANLADGELLLKGPSLCAGYYKNPEETSRTFINGWYHTGDLAEVDEEGMYYLTGRKKNLIILSNGENVSPEEIEQKIIKHKEIKEILVREERGFIGAVIFPEYPKSADDVERALYRQRIDAIVDDYNLSVPSYKQIEFITYVQAPLPKTASGKVIRYNQ